MERNILRLEERILVKEAIILTYILDILDQERKRLEGSTNLLQVAHLATMEAVFDAARLELIDLKKDLKARNIKYNDGIHQSFILEFEIWCRGYKNIFNLTRDHARSEIGVKLGRISGEIESIMKKRPTR